MSAARPKSRWDGMVLAILEAAPRHAYAIGELLREDSEGLLDPPAYGYSVLNRLERAGLVQSTCSEVHGVERRTYELTPAGERALDAERCEWREFCGGNGHPGTARISQ